MKNFLVKNDGKEDKKKSLSDFIVLALLCRLKRDFFFCWNP